nr:ParA superfamily DNA segregation protein PrgP [Lactiplantibacillus plantarum]
MKLKKGRVVVLTNLKGGVGKTTDTDLLAIVASKSALFNQKVLLIDVDLQANTTNNIKRTFNVNQFPQSFVKAAQTGTLKNAIMPLTENLDIIAGSIAEHELVDSIIDNSKNKRERYFYFKKMVDEIRPKYDYIFFDVAPSTDSVVDAIIMVTDYIIAVQEVKRMAMEGTSNFISNYLQPMLNNFPNEAKFQVAGILPALLSSRRKTQLLNYKKTVARYGEDNVFHTIVKNHDRLEAFGENGFSLNDYNDRKMFALFADLFTELELRIESFEKTGDVKDFRYESHYFDSMTNTTLPAGKEIQLDGIAE